MFKHIAFACLLGVVAGAPYAPLTGYATVAAVDHVSIPRYSFNYAVNDPLTGDNKAQTEYRDGGVVKGSYSVAEPDGTLRVVDYHADPVTGFNADVKRIGPAVHPQPILHKPIIAAPIAPISTSIVGLGGLGGWGAHSGVGLGGLGLGYNTLGLGYSGLGLGLGHGHGWKY
ncbi:adult-specific cuticular protein ACP-20-like [Ostrinia nubilalis]|uniref:adult-specific cuticular protein ACP-20-like n=1 Tax=Ostrinia nubilalis TaxID=29057 RepID=UPI0030824362